MPGPQAGDRHLAVGPVKYHPESREAQGDVQHPGHDHDRHQENTRKENRIMT